MRRMTSLLLLAAMVLTLLLPLSSCGLFEPKWIGRNGEFTVTIDGVSGFSSLDFEISQSYNILVELDEDVAVNDETYKDIKIEYNEENAVVYYSYYSNFRSQIGFYIYLYELGQGNELAITYNGKTTKISYNVVDYDFEGRGYVTIDSIAYVDRYPEFKDMLFSIERYEFTEPYVGIDKYDIRTQTGYNGEQTQYWFGMLNVSEENPDYVSTDYLKYLKDSVYYPKKFSSVPDNPISSFHIDVELPLSAGFDEGSGRETMNSFYISYGVIDPCCTDPQNPIRSMTFSAQIMERAMTYSRQKVDGIYPSQVSIFLEKYADRFFVYDLDGITVYILCHSDGGARAYFEDGTYFYTIYAGYET